MFFSMSFFHSQTNETDVLTISETPSVAVTSLNWKGKWAVEVDVSSPVTDFYKKIPSMAYQVRYIQGFHPFANSVNKTIEIISKNNNCKNLLDQDLVFPFTNMMTVSKNYSFVL